MSTSEIREFILQCWYPRSYEELIISWIVLSIVLALGVLGLISRSKSTIVKLLLVYVWLAVFTMYIVTGAVIRPYTQKFDQNNVGIAIAHFSGAKLEKHFGAGGLEERIRQKLNLKFRELSIHDLISVEVLSWEPRDRNEAEDLKARFSATLLIWGNIMKDNTANLIINSKLPPYDVNTLLWRSNGTRMLRISRLLIERSGEFQLRLDSLSNEDSLIDPIIHDVTPSVCEVMLSIDTTRYLMFVDTLPTIRDRVKYQAWAPGLFAHAAQVALNRVDTTRAMLWFKRSFEYCCTLQSASLDWVSDKPVDYTRIAAYCKFREGFLLLATGDRNAALVPLIWAAILDSDYESKVRDVIRDVLGNDSSKVLFPEPPDCFVWPEPPWFRPVTIDSVVLRRMPR